MEPKALPTTVQGEGRKELGSVFDEVQNRHIRCGAVLEPERARAANHQKSSWTEAGNLLQKTLACPLGCNGEAF